jgi:acyl carrier protein
VQHDFNKTYPEQKMTLKEQIRNFILENFILENPEDLVDDESMLEKGIMDSTGVLELVAFIESTYEVKVEDEELIPENLDSIKNIVSYLERKLGLASKPEEAQPSFASQA